jgi:hypothetical protein
MMALKPFGHLEEPLLTASFARIEQELSPVLNILKDLLYHEHPRTPFQARNSNC